MLSRPGFFQFWLAWELWIWPALVGIGKSMGLSYLGGLLFDDEPPDAPQPSADSQSRSWTPRTTHREGLARTRACGKNLHYGNIVASWTDVVDNREVLYVIVDHGDGPTKGIVGGQVYLNDQPVGNFGDVVVQERLGTTDQTVMAGFEKTKIEYPLNQQALYDDVHVFTTPNDNFDDIEYTLHFPQGIIKYKKDGRDRNSSCHFRVRISVAGTDSWTTLMDGFVGSFRTVDPLFLLYKVSEQGFNCIRGTRYDLEITRKSPVSARIHNTSYIRSVREVIDIPFTRPGKALVGIKAVATGQLSGNLDVKVIREDRLINVFDGATWAIEYSRNRAWVAFDTLTQPVISGSSPPYTIERYEGIDPTKIDIAFFYAWAQYCEALIPDGYGGTELRFACDIIVDYQTDIWTLANEIANVGRASLYWKGYILTGWIDTVVTTPIDLVTMDNTMAKSWKNMRTGKDEFAGQIEVFFKDSRLGYERTSASWSNENAGIYTNIVSIEGVGITTRGTAVHVANHLLLRIQLITNTNQFRMHKDAFRYTLGKVIRLQQRTPDWGHAYKVESSAASDVVTLHRAPGLNVKPGDTLYVRTYDDDAKQVVTDDYVVQGIDGKDVTVTTAWAVIPVRGNLVAIGRAGDIKLRRIIKIEPDVKNHFNVTVETYDVNLFDADDLDPMLPDKNYVWPAPARPLNEYMTQEGVSDIVNQLAPPLIDTDMPTTSNLKFTGSGGDTVTWTAEDADEPIQFNYKGTEHEITPNSTVNEFIYWNPGSPTSFLNTNNAAVAAAPGNWVVCRNNAGVVESAQAMQIIHGGLIQAGTITAAYAQIAALAVVTGNIANLAVTAAKIGALAVTNAKIGNLQVDSAKIANLTVGGDKITAWATHRGSDNTGAYHGIGGAGSWVTILSTTIPSIGNMISVACKVKLTHSGVSLDGVAWRLVRGATVVDYGSSASSSADGDTISPFMQSLEVPGSGNKTYSLQCKELAGTGWNVISSVLHAVEHIGK